VNDLIPNGQTSGLPARRPASAECVSTTSLAATQTARLSSSGRLLALLRVAQGDAGLTDAGFAYSCLNAWYGDSEAGGSKGLRRPRTCRGVPRPGTAQMVRGGKPIFLAAPIGRTSCAVLAADPQRKSRGLLYIEAPVMLSRCSPKSLPTHPRPMKEGSMWVVGFFRLPLGARAVGGRK